MCCSVGHDEGHVGLLWQTGAFRRMPDRTFFSAFDVYELVVFKSRKAGEIPGINAGVTMLCYNGNTKALFHSLFHASGSLFSGARMFPLYGPCGEAAVWRHGKTDKNNTINLEDKRIASHTSNVPFYWFILKLIYQISHFNFLPFLGVAPLHVPSCKTLLIIMRPQIYSVSNQE